MGWGRKIKYVSCTLHLKNSKRYDIDIMKKGLKQHSLNNINWGQTLYLDWTDKEVKTKNTQLF